MWPKCRDFRDLCKESVFSKRGSEKIRSVPRINLVINYEEENRLPSIPLRTGRTLGVHWEHNPIQKLSSLLLWALSLPALCLWKAALGLLCSFISIPSFNIYSTQFHSQFLPFGFVKTLFLSLKSFFPLLARNPLLQERLSYPFSVTTVKSNLTWDRTESCSVVLATRLESEESLRAFSIPTVGHNCHLLAAFQEAWAGGKCCVDGGKQIISLHSNPFHHDWGILGLMGEAWPGACVSKFPFPLLYPAVIVILLPSETRNSSDLFYLSASLQYAQKEEHPAEHREFFSVHKHPCLCHFAALCQRLIVGFRSHR